MASLKSVQPYFTPIDASLYPTLSVVLLGVGIFFLTWFFVYEMTTSNEATATTKRRNIWKELSIASVASVFLGFGTLFLLLWTGVYV